MCSAFSSLQNINFARMTPEEVEKVKTYGKVHLDFCAELYQEQINNKLYFLHEHPHDAASWKENSIKSILAQENVVKVKSHMCAFGMEQEDAQGKAAAGKGPELTRPRSNRRPPQPSGGSAPRTARAAPKRPKR